MTEKAEETTETTEPTAQAGSVVERLVRLADDNFTIRRDVFNMSTKMWIKLGTGGFTGTPREFLERIGLPGGLSALFTEEEQLFFDCMYALKGLEA